MPNEAAEIVAELKRINRLMAAAFLRDLTQRQKIELLATAGFQPKEIAELVGTTPNTVSVELVKIRRRKLPRRTAPDQSSP